MTLIFRIFYRLIELFVSDKEEFLYVFNHVWRESSKIGFDHFVMLN